LTSKTRPTLILVTKRTALADFLRARRDMVSPADVGLPGGDRRRVAGLRREEVAVLAGISTEYYVRLEQGREHKPSHEVLVGIGRALKLNDDAVTYMHGLARQRPCEQTQSTALDPAIAGLIAGWPFAAAHVTDRGLTTVAANGLARALSPHLDVGANTLRNLFLDSGTRDFYRNWHKVTAWAVPLVRSFVGLDPNPELLGLIDELTKESKRFRHLWAHHEVKHDSSGLILLNHPRAGPLDLHFQHLDLPGTGYTIVVYWADPGSSSEEGMRRLAAQ
jgi:transcriptional regulator with XRE-family HTH domain